MKKDLMIQYANGKILMTSAAPEVGREQALPLASKKMASAIARARLQGQT